MSARCSTMDSGAGIRRLLVAATALAIVLDGLDNQVLSGALPAIMRDWHVPRSALTPALTSGLVGMMLGGFIGGVVGDRLGRRVALLGSVVTFGVLTLMVPLATTPLMLWCCGSSPGWASAARCPTPRRSRPNTCRGGIGRSP